MLLGNRHLLYGDLFQLSTRLERLNAPSQENPNRNPASRCHLPATLTSQISPACAGALSTHFWHKSTGRPRRRRDTSGSGSSVVLSATHGGETRALGMGVGAVTPNARGIYSGTRTQPTLSAGVAEMAISQRGSRGPRQIYLSARVESKPSARVTTRMMSARPPPFARQEIEPALTTAPPFFYIRLTLHRENLP